MTVRKPGVAALLFTLTMLSVLIAFAQNRPTDNPSIGVLLLAHGGADSWNEEVAKLASDVSKSVPVEVAYGMATKRTIQDAIDRLVKRGVREIAAVPLFVSSHSSVITSTEYLLGLRSDPPTELAVYAGMSHDHAGHSAVQSAEPSFDPSTPVKSPVPIRMTAALDAHPLVAEILQSRARSISKDPAHETIVLVAHGPVTDSENAKWLSDMASLAETIRSVGSFNHIEYLTVRDDAPEPIRSQAAAQLRAVVVRATREGDRALILPLLISYGGIEAGIRKRLEGLSYVMSSQGLLPDERIARWVVLAAQGSVPVVATKGPQQNPAGGTFNTGSARELLKAIRETRGQWDGEFPGFEADLEVFHRNRSYPGHVSVSNSGAVHVELPDSAAKDWVSATLASLATHSIKRDFDKTDGRHELAFAPEEQNPLGRLIKVQEDPYDSSYRVRQNIISQVNRRMGKQHFSIDVLHMGRDEQGYKTSESFVVNTFDNSTNRLVKTEAFRDEFTIVGAYRLPKVRCVIVAEPGGTWTESMTLSNHRLAAAAQIQNNKENK